MRNMFRTSRQRGLRNLFGEFIHLPKQKNCCFLTVSSLLIIKLVYSSLIFSQKPSDIIIADRIEKPLYILTENRLNLI